MVTLDVVRAANAALAAADAGRPFVAVFTGGTAGIGMYAVKALAETHGAAAAGNKKPPRGLRVYIVGRRASDGLLAECRALCPHGTFAFVPAQDLGRLRDVDRVCAAVAAAETAAAAREGHAAQIDLLVLSQGVLAFGGRDDTPEGLHHPTALIYYGRMRVVDRLLPLLTAGAGDGAAGGTAVGHVVSVLNPNLEGRLVADDLSLRQPRNFASLFTRGSHGALMTLFYLEALAARHPDRLAAVHYYPGFVVTDIAKNSPLAAWQRFLAAAAAPLLARLFAVPPAECGHRVIFLANTDVYPPRGGRRRQRPDGPAAASSSPALPTGLAPATGSDGQPGSGVYRIHYNDEPIASKPRTDAYRAEGLVDAVYQHTQAAFAAIEAGKAFTD